MYLIAELHRGQEPCPDDGNQRHGGIRISRTQRKPVRDTREASKATSSKALEDIWLSTSFTQSFCLFFMTLRLKEKKIEKIW